MKTLKNITKFSLVALALVSSVTSLHAEFDKKKFIELVKRDINQAAKDGTAVTVVSKHKFTYNIIPGMKLPAAGTKVKGQNNPMNLSLDKNGEIVTDHNTKLQWASRTLLVWTNLLKATEYCSNLRTGGYDDWRIPTIKELTSVNDYDIFEPSFSRKFFPGVPAQPSGFWAVPEGVGHPLNAWHIGFDGHVMGQSADATKMTRCVRADNLGGYDKNLFKDNGNGTVTDDLTNLVWQQADDGKQYLFKEAKPYCENLVLGGRDDWRVPHVKELISINNYNKHRPAMDEEFFKEIKPHFYWTQSLDPSFGTNTVSGMMNSGVDGIPRAWGVETVSGSAWLYRTTDKFSVRCVTDKK